MRKKQRHRSGTARLEPLKQQLQAEARLAGREIVFQEGGGGEKMSEVLVALIEPYQEAATTFETFQRLIALGAIAWNAALLPRKARRELLDETIATELAAEDPETRREFRNCLVELIARKERLFPHNKRFIASYRVTETRNNYRVSVASTLEGLEEGSGGENALPREGAAGAQKPSRAARLTCLALLAIAVLAVGLAVRWLVMTAIQLLGSARHS